VASFRNGRTVSRALRRPAVPIGLVLFLACGLLTGVASGAVAATASGWLRVGHFAAASPAVDVYVDGALLSSRIGFEQVTPYAHVAPGPHTVVLRPAGAAATSAPVLAAAASVAANGATTVAVVGNGSGLAASVYQDDLSPPPPGTAKVRVIHTIGGVPAVDVFVSPAAAGGSAPASLTAASTPAFAALPFGGASPYADLPAGSYDVELRVAGSSQVLLSAHSWPVQANTVASIVVLSPPQGVTIEVLRDAAGATATPVGAMATGAGGTARRGDGARTPGFSAIVVIVAVGLAVVATRRWRPSRAGPPRGSAGAAGGG
jgi:hypothetical protein